MGSGEDAGINSNVPSQPKKRFHLSKWHIFTCVLILIIGVQAAVYVMLTNSYNLLMLEHQNLGSKYTVLANQHSQLQSDYSDLQSEYDTLQSNYNSLNVGYNSYAADYSNLRSQINTRDLYLDVKSMISPDDSAIRSQVLQITGGWSNPSDWNEYWDDVKKMYDWVVGNIEYRSDGLFPIIPSTPTGHVEYVKEMWQFANETLNLKQGDCEDMAILLTSMIRSYTNGRFEAECIWISGSIAAHMGVQMYVSGDKLTIFDPAGKYYTSTWYGSVDSKDISTEISNWLNYWKSGLGNDAHVERVFSDNIDISFLSTSEYTSWMYNRY